ncbi:YgaP family membrane protein [Corynebacterium propinquum]
MKRNESNQDRGIRAVLGIIALLVGLFAVGGFLRALLIIVGLVLIITAAVGFCPLYRLLGINTCKVRR